MNKNDIDIYFTKNYSRIIEYIESNRPKCYTANDENIITYIYDVCLKKADVIENIDSFIKITASNMYRWKNSRFNIENKVLCNKNDFSYTYIEDQPSDDDEEYQRLDYALKKYYIKATPSERIFYDVYVNKGKRTHREVREYVGVSDRGARKLIKEFKEAIKNHFNERKE